MFVLGKAMLSVFVFGLLGFFVPPAKVADTKFEVIKERKELNRIVPASFYFAGLSGGTQMRNSAVGKFAKERFIVSAMVDVSGYSTDISGVYEGFFITDSKVTFGDKELPIGAYGIGFSKAGEARIFDLSGKQIYTTAATFDKELRRPRPLMMTIEKDGIRLYKGRQWVLVKP